MAEGKKSFVMYCDLIHTVIVLSDDEAGKLFKHLLRYVNDENPQTDDRLIKIAFEPIKQQLKRDLQEWGVIKEGKSHSGKLGNLKRWNPDLFNKVIAGEMSTIDAENIAKHRKTSHSDKFIANIAVNDNVTVNVNDNVINNKKEKIRAFNEKYKADLLLDYAQQESLMVQCKGLTINEELLKVYNAHLMTESRLHESYTEYLKNLRNWFNTKPKLKAEVDKNVFSSGKKIVI